jgi:protein-S-isoprenylcysteine O-methyltransferase Ste14
VSGAADARARFASLAGFLLAVAGIVALVETRQLFSPAPAVVTIQVAAFALMLWARVTFGRRSFHAGANPTDGGLVTTGPYRLLRHPIYAAILWFVWAGAMAHRSASAIGWGALVTLGLGVRMALEERLLVRRYPEYAAYAARTRRVVPFLI